MAPTQDLRSSRFIWWVRLAQLLCGITALGLVASSSASWAAFDCSIPKRVAYTLACAVITLPFVTYLLFTTGPRFADRGFWWWWAQIGTDLFLAVLWIAAAALSAPDCDDICGACSAGGSEVDLYGEGFLVYGDSFYCYCYFPGFDDIFRKRSPAGGLLEVMKRSLLRSRASSSGKVTETAATIGARQGFGGVLIFFFVLSLISGLSIKFEWTKQRQTTHNPDHNANPENGQEKPPNHDQEVDVAGNIVRNLN